jgi:predicted transcriptional regulator
MAEKLIFPQEIEVWYILPLIRRKIALKMVEKGLQQKQVAMIMGITPAAVCQYKTEKRAKEDFFDDDMNKKLEIAVKNIIKDNNQLAEEIIKLNNLAKSKGIVCKIYKEKCALKGMKGNCDYCKNIKK